MEIEVKSTTSNGLDATLNAVNPYAFKNAQSAASALKKPHLWGQRLQDFEAAMVEMGLDAKKARYHAKHIFSWIYQRRVYDVEQMTDLPKAVRAMLAEHFDLTPPVAEALEQKSTDGTRKFLFKLFDGQTIESVLIPVFSGENDPDAQQDEEGDRSLRRMTICISSQVGCAMGCKFCFTATMGLIRNLKVEEIVGQVLKLSELGQISNIVFMGMGEPLHNLENVARAIEILLDQHGMNFSKRKVTVSTSGLVPQIRKFNERLSTPNRVNLAISLNGSSNENRQAVMPVNKAFPIEELLEACKDWTLEPHRRLTFEYVMLGGHNDTLEDAERVLRLLRGLNAKVNIIPFNANPLSEFKRPDDEQVTAFHRYIMDRGGQATIRHSRGRDILAACGQLKSKEDQKLQKLVTNILLDTASKN